MLREVIDRILVIFVEWSNDAVIDELTVVEIIIDQYHMDGKVEYDVQISI